jgi:hypothetical protein
MRSVENTSRSLEINDTLHLYRIFIQTYPLLKTILFRYNNLLV